MVHIGQKISERISQLGISKTELARKIDTSRENIYGILNRETIDTGLLSKISAALEFDFFQYYRLTLSALEESSVPYLTKNRKVEKPEQEPSDKGSTISTTHVAYLEKLIALQQDLLKEKEEKEQLLKAENERLRKSAKH